MKLEERLNNCFAKENETIREHNIKLKLKADNLLKLGYISEKQHFLLSEACEYHDYGKMNEFFQDRIKNGSQFNKSKEIYHNLISPVFIEKEKYEDEEDYYKIFYAVLNHHYYTDNIKSFSYNKDNILKIYAEIVGETKKISRKILKKLIEIEEKGLEEGILTGLLNKCDYSASGNYEVEYRNNFLIDRMEKLNYKWNDMQKYLIENRNENVIVVANTGMGKTEGALLWIGDTKGFFILPIRTAINSIYERLKNQILQGNIEKKLALLHSEALDYLLENSGENSYKNIKQEYINGKNFSTPLIVTTLDQIFNFVYFYNGYEFKLATLSYSKIVIDEIQAYTPDLLAYIILGLKSVVEVGGKFAILTATLPPFIKDILEEEIGKIKYKSFTVGKNRHNIKVKDEELNSKDIHNHYLNKGGKTLVICNTVKKAQAIYKELKKMGILDSELELFHAKFIKKDRLEKERNIVTFGKTENQGNKIWISTSLVEASLDVDFDYLFTELNDLSGLLQRLGRVNRKGIKNIDNINVYVFLKINNNLFINGLKGFIDRTIYTLSRKALMEVDGIFTEEKKYELINKYLTTDNLKKSDFLNEFEEMKSYIKSLKKGILSKKEVKRRFRNIVSYKAIPKDIYIEKMKEIDNLIIEYNSLIDEETKEKIRMNINEYTLSLGVYEVLDEKKFIKFGNETIYIVDGNYSNKIGFEKVIEKSSNQ